MTVFKNLIFLIVFLCLFACGDSSYRPRIPTNQSGDYHDISGGSAGLAKLADTASSQLSQLNFEIYGTQGQSIIDFRGSATFRGTLIFKEVYSARAEFNSGLNNRHLSQCPNVNVSYPFSCQARLSGSGSFRDCAVSIRGQSYTLQGMIERAQTTERTYDVIMVEVFGLCALSSSTVF